MSAPLSLVKGSLDVLVLKALSWSTMHGFEITRWLEASSGGRLEVEESALYQALHRMEARGLVTAEWGLTDNIRRARYYTLTTAGRSHLRAETARWIQYATALTSMLTASPKPAPR